MPCRFCFVCSGQTIVWWQHTMVWCEHTIVCRQQTINEARLRPTEDEHSNELFHALQTNPATRRRVNQKEEITRENESFTAGCLKSKASPAACNNATEDFGMAANRPAAKIAGTSKPPQRFYF
ncbi:hypothetical protein JJE63_00450 [Alloprevotella tannerae]|uniref:hypothetical protein n=1 Tax=Alloprevotella tannerae TaxID=76122 RepID=UPI001EDB94E3|nr:hypothetical protein [Alloprevotella tannerae]MCG2651809.1 hypothetical protein [Alloprevotella tannerae]